MFAAKLIAKLSSILRRAKHYITRVFMRGLYYAFNK